MSWYNTHMRSIALSLTLFACSACASTHPLPAVGDALLTARDAYVRLHAAHTAVCQPPVPEPLVRTCGESAEALEQARVAFNVAVDVYTTINEEVGE